MPTGISEEFLPLKTDDWGLFLEFDIGRRLTKCQAEWYDLVSKFRFDTPKQLRQLEEEHKASLSSFAEKEYVPIYEAFATKYAQLQDEMTEQAEFSGDYASWAEAASESTGYYANEILEKILSATLAVKTGKAVAQRDGVLLEKIPYNFPLIAMLLRAALEDGNRLDVLDFGGSLGRSYFDSRGFLQGVAAFNWSIIEQPHFVAAGRANLACSHLHFYETIEECLQERSPNVVILSGVLQYLPDTWGTLQALLDLHSRYLFVDRTQFLNSESDRLTVQHVPAWIYEASMPARLLSETKFLRSVEDSGYQVIAEFPPIDDYNPPGADALYKGFICATTGLRVLL
jgi:putative methyltransferase (TIGR04325 family)